jgi:signal transduction histidine kinase
MGDPVRIRQIIVNLLGNAIKFTKRGRDFCFNQEAGDYFFMMTKYLNFIIEVKDTGIGIAKDKLQKYLRFYPGRQFNNQEIWRHGPGAHDLKSLAELMHGTTLLKVRRVKGVHFPSVCHWKFANDQPEIQIPTQTAVEKGIGSG